MGPGQGGERRTHEPGARTRWLVGPSGRVFPIPRAGVRRRSASGARASVSQKGVQKPEIGKISFDQMKVFLNFAYLSNLGTEFKNTPIG